jgi:O-antigen ligase
MWRDLVVAGTLVGGMAVLTLGLVVSTPARVGLLLLAGGAGLVAIGLGLRDPLVACVYLLAATFFRLAIPSGTLPVDPFLIAFAGLLAAVWLWSRPWERRLSRGALDPITWAIGLYIGWNLVSMLVPHAYPAGSPRDPEPFSVTRFVLIGTVMPLTMFLVGRRLFVTRRAVRLLLWSALAAGAYSALVSIGQFAAPQLVWPTYILHNASWPDRAVGIFNQPVVNGLVLIVGYLVALLVASHRGHGVALRVAAGLIGVAGAYGVYLTHTRAVWLSFVLVVVAGAAVAKGFRTGFVLTLGVMVLTVVTHWSTFTSADRSAGGVESPEEVQDRLNTIATSLWAFRRAPLFGWGIGRFATVNFYDHQQWSPAVPWVRGLGIPSHEDSLGILVELGVVGLGLWLVAFGLIYTRIIRVTRRLPADGLYGRGLALTALLALLAQTTTGLTVDLRFFDFPNIIVMLLVGAAIGWGRARSSPDGAAPPVPAVAATDVLAPAVPA